MSVVILRCDLMQRKFLCEKTLHDNDKQTSCQSTWVHLPVAPQLAVGHEEDQAADHQQEHG